MEVVGGLGRLIVNFASEMLMSVKTSPNTILSLANKSVEGESSTRLGLCLGEKKLMEEKSNVEVVEWRKLAMKQSSLSYRNVVC